MKIRRQYIPCRVPLFTFLFNFHVEPCKHLGIPFMMTKKFMGLIQQKSNQPVKCFHSILNLSYVLLPRLEEESKQCKQI